jgi:hypothetical protein
MLLGLFSSSVTFHTARLEIMNFVIRVYPKVNGGSYVSCRLTQTCTVEVKGKLKSRLTDRHVPTHVEQLVNNQRRRCNRLETEEID